MRHFELTIGVFIGDRDPLPATFNQWITAAGLSIVGSSPTTLKRVVETRYPIADDVVEKRAHKKRQWS